MLTVRNKIINSLFLVPTLLCLYVLSRATPAWAVQAHGGSEGLIAHQVGHILFFIGMIFLLIRQHRRNLTGSGWREFKIFLWLIILWNILTFSGHWMREVMDLGKLITIDKHIIGLQAMTPFDFIFYLTRLDHLVLVPAFLFLLIALKRWDNAS